MDQLDGVTFFRAASLDSIEGLPPRRIPLMDTIRDRIGNPRLSTFGHLTPTARNFNEAQRVKLAMPPSDLTRMDSGSNVGGLERKSLTSGPIIISANGNALTDIDSSRTTPVPLIARPRPARTRPRPDSKARVTLHYDGLCAPTLVMRFSMLEMPSPETVFANLEDISPSNPSPPSHVESIRRGVVKRRPMSAHVQSIPNPFDDPDIRSLRPLRRASTQILRKRDGSVATTGTFDPMAEVRALANKFPSPPDHTFGRTGADVAPKPAQHKHEEDERTYRLNRSSSGNSKHSSMRSNSVRRKPVPGTLPGLMAQSFTYPMPPPAQPSSTLRPSTEDQHEAQIRQQLRKNWMPKAAVPSPKNSASTSDSIGAHTMGTSVAPSTPRTAVSFHNVINSAYDSAYAVSVAEDRPMGRLADRVIEMEAYLDGEKEKRVLTPVPAAPGMLGDRQVWERELELAVSPGVIAHRRPQANMNKEYPWVQNEDPVMGANADLEAAWKTATMTARTHHGVEHAGGEDHTVGKIKSLNSVTTRRQPVVRPVVHSVLSIAVEEDEGSATDQGAFVDSHADPYAPVVPAGLRAKAVPEEPDPPLDRWEPSSHTRR